MLIFAAKYLPAPFGTGLVLLASMPSFIREAIDISGFAALLAGMFLVARYRATIEAQDKAGDAAMRELEVQRERNERIEEQLAQKEQAFIAFSEEQRELRHALKNRIAELEAKTDLTGLMRVIIDNHKDLCDKLATITGDATRQPTTTTEG